MCLKSADQQIFDYRFVLRAGESIKSTLLEGEPIQVAFFVENESDKTIIETGASKNFEAPVGGQIR